MTLIEVLLVVFIVGLLGGLAVMTFPSPAPPEAKAAQALQRAVLQAQDQAILTGESLGLVVHGQAYGFVAWRENRWVALREPAGQLPEGFRLRVIDPGSNPPGTPDEWPLVRFDPLGETGPVGLSLESEGVRSILRIGADGEVVLDAQT